jgi:hypothetical protein
VGAEEYHRNIRKPRIRITRSCGMFRVAWGESPVAIVAGLERERYGGVEVRRERGIDMSTYGARTVLRMFEVACLAVLKVASLVFDVDCGA